MSSPPPTTPTHQYTRVVSVISTGLETTSQTSQVTLRNDKTLTIVTTIITIISMQACHYHTNHTARFHSRLIKFRQRGLGELTKKRPILARLRGHQLLLPHSPLIGLARRDLMVDVEAFYEAVLRLWIVLIPMLIMGCFLVTLCFPLDVFGKKKKTT